MVGVVESDVLDDFFSRIGEDTRVPSGAAEKIRKLVETDPLPKAEIFLLLLETQAGETLA